MLVFISFYEHLLCAHIHTQMEDRASHLCLPQLLLHLILKFYLIIYLCVCECVPLEALDRLELDWLL